VEFLVAGLHKSIHTNVKFMYQTTQEDVKDHALTYEERDTLDDSDATLVPKRKSCGGARPSTPDLAALL
jgi:hypothetical protein